MTEILIIIPARGGSKGIPRKNLRILNGYPLIYYVIQTALKSRFSPDVYVSSDDDEILTMAKKFGASIHNRKKSLADSRTTLDPVIINAYQEIVRKTGKKYNIVVTIQPTSPLLTVKTLDDAIQTLLKKNKIDTLISATDDTHLTWKIRGNHFVPDYIKRVNRQELPPVYRETGAFLMARPENFKKETRIGKNIDLFIVPSNEKIDVDDFEDWSVCEFYLKRKKILFVVTGNRHVGLGHVYNALSLADEILDHQVMFLVDKKSKLAYHKIQSSNHVVYFQREKNLLNDIEKLVPEVIVNDMLDTDKSYILALKGIAKYIINFEDLGEGSHYADLVINAMYPESGKYANHYYGHRYFVLRNEFQFSLPVNMINRKVRQVMLSFGGVDPNDFTHRVIEEIYDFCQKQGISIKVALGLGYNRAERIKSYPKVKIYQNISYLSDLVIKSDICFTSAGRTTFEMASLGVPTLILCQNKRETSHFFASENYGFINLGLGYQLKPGEILKAFRELVENYELRLELHRRMLSFDLRKSKQNVIQLIRDKIL